MALKINDANLSRSLYLFNCQGTLESETRAVTVDEVNENDLYTCFGHEFVDRQCFVQRLPVIFNIARQRWTRFQRHCCSNSSVVKKEENWWFSRKEIMTFFWNLRNILNSLDFQEKQFAIPLIVENLNDLHHFGNLNKLNWEQPSHFYSHHNFEEHSLYHFFHLNLDFRWMMIILLQDIEEYGSVSEINISLDRYLQDLLCDLIGFSYIRFSNIALNDYEKSSPFTCPCLQKYWKKLVNFIDIRHEKKQTDNFWLMLHCVFREIQYQKSDFLKKLTSSLCAVNSLGFCWWLLYHLAQLSKEDSSNSSETFALNTNHRIKKVNLSNHFELNNLIKASFSSEFGGYSEIHLRCYLRCCMKILNLWEPSIETLTLLWQYFSKRLNENFKLSDDMTVAYSHGKSGNYFKNFIEDISVNYDNKHITLNSFQLFLKIFFDFLNNVQSKPHAWKDIQISIASKLRAQQMQTFNSNGLYNCCCLILVLGRVGDLDEAVNVFMETVAATSTYSSDGGKNGIVWRACFALMFLCLDHGLTIRKLEKKMIESISGVKRELHKSDDKIHSGHWTTDLLCIYFESLKDLFEHSHYLNLSQKCMLDIDLVDILSRSPESVVIVALTGIEVLVTKLRNLIRADFIENEAVFLANKLHCDDIVATLFAVVVPWMKKLVVADFIKTCSLSINVLCSICIGLAALRHAFPTRCQTTETFKVIVNYFCFGQQIDNEFTCHFVAGIIEDSALLNQARKEIVDFESQVVRVWFRLGFILPLSSPHYLQLSCTIMKLPSIKVLFTEVDLPLPDRYNNKEIIHQLLKILGLHYTKCMNIMHIRSKVAIYLADVTKIVQANLKSNKQDLIMQMYTIVGHIFQEIAPLIYIKSKPNCLMHEFVSLLLLPSAIYGTNTKISTPVLIALKENICLYIEGISELDFVNDPYVGRTLRDIFTRYLSRFSLNYSSLEMSMHPIFISLINVRQRNRRSSEFLIHVMEAVRDHYINRRESHPQLGLGLLFIKEVITHSSIKDRCLICPVLLTPLLKLMLFPEFKQTLADIFKLLVDALPRDHDSSIVGLFESLQQILYDHFKNYQTIPQQIFQLLQTVSVIYPDTIQRMNLVIGDIISEREKEICGSDEILRQRYREFLDNLQRFPTI